MKKPRLEIIMGPVFVFAVLIILPLFFEINYLHPIKDALSDFDITDVGIQLGRKNEKLEADTNIVIINVNKIDYRKLYYILDELSKYQPKVVGVDLIVDGEENPEYIDSVLFALTKLPNSVFASELKNYEESFGTFTSIQRAHGPFLQLASSGYKNILFGKNRKTNTARTFRPRINESGLDEHSFALEVAEKFDKKSVIDLIERNNREEIIEYFGNKNSFFRMNENDLLSANFDPSVIVGKIVLIGRLNPNDGLKYLEDMYFTPLCEMDNGKPFPDMYDVVVQANIIKMITERRFYNSLSEVIIILISVLLIYINFWLFYLISDKLPIWYEILSNLLFLLQSLVILVLVILLYNKLRLQADFTMGLFGLAITIIFFEAYKENIVPLLRKTIYVLKHRRI
jgi:CHASE2 domain-containing sensor protein